MIPRSLCLLFLAASAPAATITGADYGGANLIPANGDTLSGVFTNVGLFDVGPGTTAFVAPGVSLAVYAATVSVRGVLNGVGRGQNGGNGGPLSGAGLSGFGGGPSGSGGGGGGASLKSGAGGGAAGNGGAGAGNGGGSSGSLYGSTGVVSSPISADDAFQGSGGGGGGGNASQSGGGGAAGGASVYIEAASMTVTGSILVSGSTAAAVTDTAAGNHPGAGGGGGGGTVLLRIPGRLGLSAGTLAANGGGGGDAVVPTFCGTLDPGGGGAGGRVKIFYGQAAGAFQVSFSTSGGPAGGTEGFCGAGSIDNPKPVAGDTGTVSFGIIASSPTNFAATSVYVTSIAWSWNAASFGDAPANTWSYRLYPATATAPYPSAEATAASGATSVVSTALSPNTTYFRFLTAASDWGDGLPSNAVSTHTLASPPGSAAQPFSALSDVGLTFSWTAGSPANPDYTVFRLERATEAAFNAPATSFAASLSSSPAGLLPNTSYYFRALAVNLDGVPAPAAPAAALVLATATLASVPGAPAVGEVAVTSAAFSWSRGANPADTVYAAQISTDNFFTINDASATVSSSAAFFNLSPGTQYFFRVLALNRFGLPSAYSTVISTRPGLLADSTPPSVPAAPTPDRAYSYDGTAAFRWPASQSAVGVLDYNLLIGSTPGGNDFFSGSTTTISFAVSGLSSGRTYYARVRARSNAGVYSEFSDVGPGLPVFLTAQTSAMTKPINWPNPFNPAQGPTQIGFFLDGPATVTLKIYDLQGLLVYSQTQSYGGGNQIMPWNGAASSGARVAPGGYIATLQKSYGNRSDTQRLKLAVLY